MFPSHEKPLNKVHSFLPNQRPGAGCVRPEGGESLAEPMAPPAQPAKGKNRLLIAIVAILIVALIGLAAFAVLSARVPQKFSFQLWYNNDGHYGDTETALALTLQNSIKNCGKVTVTLKSDPWAVFKHDRSQGTIDAFLLASYRDYVETRDYISLHLASPG